MKRIIFLLCAMLAMSAANAQSAAQKYAELTEAKCPMKVSDGLIWQSTAYMPDSSTILISFSIDAKIVPFGTLKQSADMLHEGKVADLITASDSENVLLRKACAEEGDTIRYVFASGAEAFAIKITPDDLK